MDLRKEWEKSEDGVKEKEMKTKLREQKKEKKDHSLVIKIVSSLVAAGFLIYAVYCVIAAII